MKKTSELDQIYHKLLSKINNLSDVEIQKYKNEMINILKSDAFLSKRTEIINRIKKFSQEVSKNSKSTPKILDYGSGGGQTVIYLLLSGLDVKGVCIGKNSEGNNLSEKLGFGQRFWTYDTKKLPFENECFDIVYSEQVLEHVLDLDSYYSEAQRVLRPGGIAYFSFPQRMIPYDAHTKTWLIHYLPKSARDLCYSFLGKDINYVNSILNFKWNHEHKNSFSKYFKNFKNITPRRLIDQTQNDKTIFKYDSLPRKAMSTLLRTPIINKPIASLFANISNVDWVFYKEEQ